MILVCGADQQIIQLFCVLYFPNLSMYSVGGDRPECPTGVRSSGSSEDGGGVTQAPVRMEGAPRDVE